MLDRLEAIYRGALAALSAEEQVVRALAHEGAELLAAQRVTVFALGKPALAMARGAKRVLPGCTGIAVAAAPGEAPPGFELLVGSHPLPDERSVEAGRRLLELARAVPSDGAALFLIAGGGSALAAVPAEGGTLEDKQQATRSLLFAGAPIEELNAIRKHLSAIKGGQLAAACPAAVRTALILSDVVGDRLDVVASGPTVADPTTFEDCLAIASRRRVGLPERALARFALGVAGRVAETPKAGDPRLAEMDNRLLAGVGQLTEQAAALAEREGLQAVGVKEPIAGDALRAAEILADEARRLPVGAVLVASGEPTVRPSGEGRGGRAQHLALLLARALQGQRVAILVAGSDGHDFTTGAAGARVDGGSWQRAREQGLDPDAMLERFDSASLAGALGAQMPAFDSGTSVGDLALVARIDEG